MTRTWTGSRCWFRVVLRTFTKPWPGRLWEGRTARISASTSNSSPGRTARGHFISSAQTPMTPPAGLRSPSTRRRMVRAAVCQPLADRPWKNEARAASSSRWNGCGSKAAAKALIASASTRSRFVPYFCPTAKSSRYRRVIRKPAMGRRDYHRSPLLEETREDPHERSLLAEREAFEGGRRSRHAIEEEGAEPRAGRSEDQYLHPAVPGRRAATHETSRFEPVH